MTNDQFERALQEIEERHISITEWCKENNVRPRYFYTKKWLNKNKEVKVSKAISPINENKSSLSYSFKINDLLFTFDDLNEELIKVIIKACSNV